MESTSKTPDLNSALQLLLTSQIRQTPSELAFNQLVFEEVSTLIRKTLEKIGKHEGV